MELRPKTNCSTLTTNVVGN